MLRKLLPLQKSWNNNRYGYGRVIYFTAKAIAKELGILEYDKQALTAQELDKMSDSELQNSIENYRVFARVAPKDKVRIVEAWQKEMQLLL